MSVLVVPVPPDSDWSDKVHCMSGSTERRSTTETEQVRFREEPAVTGRGLLEVTSTTGTGRSAGRGGHAYILYTDWTCTCTYCSTFITHVH